MSLEKLLEQLPSMLTTANARLMDGSRLSAAGWETMEYLQNKRDRSRSQTIPEASGDLEIVYLGRSSRLHGSSSVLFRPLGW